MELFVTILHVTVALFMILVVLVQGGNQGGISAAFGGGNSQGVFGASGATSLLGKLTYVAAGIFMATTISLTILMGKGGDVGLTDKLREAQKKEGLVYPEQMPGTAAPKAEQAPVQPAESPAAPTTPKAEGNTSPAPLHPEQPATTPPAAPEKAAAPVPAAQ